MDILAAMRRLGAYSLFAAALIWLAFALHGYLHQALLGSGMTDAVTLGGLLDQLADWPPFTNLRLDAGAFVLGALGWWLVRRDSASADFGRNGVIRATFIAALAAVAGFGILLQLLLIVHNVALVSQSPLPFAAPLAAIAAWGAALVLVLIEWGLGGDLKDQFDEMGERAALTVISLVQWAVAGVAVWAVAQAVQSYLQALIDPLQPCSTDLNILAQIFAFILRFFQQCTDVAQPAGATLSLLLVAAALVLYSLWRAPYHGDALHNLDAVVGMAIAAVTITLSAVLATRLVLDSLTGDPAASLPRSLLSTPGELGLQSYPAAGPLIAGLCLLGYYMQRLLRRRGVTIEYGVVTLSYPPAAVAIAGACWLLGDGLVFIFDQFGLSTTGVTAQDWLFGWMLFIPGAVIAGVILLLWLRRFHIDYDGNPTTPVRLYIRSYYGIPLLVAIACGLLCIALLTIDGIELPFGLTSAALPRVAAIGIVNGLVAIYYDGVRRRVLVKS